MMKLKLRYERYGRFNAIHIGYAPVYYFFLGWVLRSTDGNLLSAEFQHRTIDSVELPRSRFIITDPLLIGLAVFALFQLPGAGEGGPRDGLVGLGRPPHTRFLVLTLPA